VFGTTTLLTEMEKDDLILTADLSETVTGLNTVNIDYVSEFTFKEIILSKGTLNLEIIEAVEPQEEE